MPSLPPHPQVGLDALKNFGVRVKQLPLVVNLKILRKLSYYLALIIKPLVLVV